MKLIVGLGNPGKQYEKTRHNAGCTAIAALHASLASYRVSPWSAGNDFHADISGCTIGAEKVILAKPTTYMNESGRSVGAIARFYKIPARDIIVAHDDKDIPLGEIKVQTGRGAAGHHGVESIMASLATEDFTRVRIGIKSKNEKRMRDTAAFVLSRFGIFERGALASATHAAVSEMRRLLGIAA